MFSVYADGQLIYFPIEEELTIHTPKLTLEMGKAGSFQFGLPPTNRYYDRLRQLRTIITVEYDDVEIFRGRVLTINRGFNKIRDIYCEGDLAYLVDSVQKGEKYEGTTHELFRKIIQNHNARMEASKQFVVGNIGIENREIIITGQDEDIQSEDDDNKDRRKSFDWFKQIAINGMVDEWSTTFDYIQNTIIDYCGGYLRTRHVGNTTYIDLLQDYTGTSIQKIEFGTNLIDLTEEVKSEDVYTVLIPLGDENLTISGLDDFDESRISKVGDELRDKTAISLYGRIVKTHVFDNVNKAETLLTNARRLMDSHENMPITFTVKAVDMHMVDESAGAIYVGDRVYVNSIPHDITQYLTCTKIEYDFDNHANDTYTFGNPKQTMTERYKKDKEKASKSGRSRGGGGGGSAGAAAVEEAEDFAVSNSKKTADEFFDAWIKVDKEAGAISLGALYEQYKSGKTVLKNSVGIDLDAPAGTINIYDTHKKAIDAYSTLENNLGINMDGPQGKINIFADHSIVTNTKNVLQNNLGIDLDAPAGTLNIFSDHKQITDIGDVITNKLKLKLDGTQGIIDLSADHEKVGKIGDTLTNKLKLKLDASQGVIDLGVVSTTTSQMAAVITRDLGLKLDASNGQVSLMNTLKGLSESSAKFESMVSGTKVTVGMYAQLGNKVSSVETWINNNKSKIVFNADMVSYVGTKIIDARDAMFKAGWTMSGRLTCVDLYSSGYMQAKDIKNSNVANLRNLTVTGTCKCDYKGTASAVASEAWVKQYIKDNVLNKLSGYASSNHKHEVTYYRYNVTKKINEQQKAVVSGPT